MARWTGEWLSSLGGANETAGGKPSRWPGERLGLPESGPGSVVGAGRRLLALLLDLLLASLLTSLFVLPDYSNVAVMQEYNLWSLAVWAAITVLPVTFFGTTPGMVSQRVRVARLDGGSVVGLPRAVLRAVLTFLIIPAAVRNEDGRGWHDRLTGTVVVLMR
ncbi:putative RDD family membrane protein YckC [Saccharomonospora amisosensis]|uniref:Putative RDD family membrane protein YckC n=1 Tax=Saccharomonospora amisosensis TaxID=1128677 RepID=A0A7X5UTB6_9PSEU|nr:RDD family protein [Saccharomonospora amisosensis]NIJ13866.1 putative RDD family membrane protein YckC [Saccharomonospora amisosensis]